MKLSRANNDVEPLSFNSESIFAICWRVLQKECSQSIPMYLLSRRVTRRVTGDVNRRVLYSRRSVHTSRKSCLHVGQSCYFCRMSVPSSGGEYQNRARQMHEVREGGGKGVWSVATRNTDAALLRPPAIDWECTQPGKTELAC